MYIANNLLKHYLKNVYFLTGTALAGKTTMSRALAQKYGFIRFNDNYHEESFRVFRSVCSEKYQPQSTRKKETTDWEAFFGRTVAEFLAANENSERSEGEEYNEFVILELITLEGDILWKMDYGKDNEKMSIHIETARLILRPFEETDAAAASDNSKQPVVAHFMSDMVLENETAALDWIRWVSNKKMDITIPCIILAVELKTNHACVGLIGVAPKNELDNEIEILFSVADTYQNRGYITEAGKMFIAWVFENTSTKFLAAIVKKDNPASSRVIEKLGFVHKGERRIDYDGEMTDFRYYRLTNPSANYSPVKYMRIETERLIIRPYCEEDFQECFALMQDEELFRYMDMDMMPIEEYRKLFNWLLDGYTLDFAQDYKYSFNVLLKETGKHIGWCGIGGLETDHAQKEIYYMIGRKYQRRGYAKEAAAALLSYGFTTMGLQRIVACCKPENIASRNVIESIGLKFQYYLKGLEQDFYNGEPFFALSREEFFNEIQKFPYIISIREHPAYLDRAADYFSSKWPVDRQTDYDSIADAIRTENALPRWYLMLKGDTVIGSFGLIENDFMVRKDLKPWLCALYVEERERGKALGARLLVHGRQEAARLGFERLYLCTEHTQYYEKYGWQFCGMEESEWGGKTRVYQIESESKNDVN